MTEKLSGNHKGGSDKGEDTEMGDAFRDVSSLARLKSKEKWESKVFEPAHINIKSLDAFLKSVFELSTPVIS